MLSKWSYTNKILKLNIQVISIPIKKSQGMNLSLINYNEQLKDDCKQFYKIASKNKSKQFSFDLVMLELS